MRESVSVCCVVKRICVYASMCVYVCICVPKCTCVCASVCVWQVYACVSKYGVCLQLNIRIPDNRNIINWAFGCANAHRVRCLTIAYPRVRVLGCEKFMDISKCTS